MSDVKRVCDCCHVDQTPLGGGIFETRNFRGHSIGLIGKCCYDDVRGMLDRLAQIHGAHIDNGIMMSSPMGTPDIKSVEELKRWLNEHDHRTTRGESESEPAIPSM